MVTPLMYLAIFTFIFRHAFPEIENYPLFALTGLIFWNFFSNGTVGIVQTVIDAKGVLKSINIPTIIFPIAELIATSINLFISFIPFGLLMFWFGAKIGWESFMILPVFFFYWLFTLGVGLVITAFNIYFRDMGLLWNSLLPAIFYFTPIAYSTKLIPAEHITKFMVVMSFNPIFHFIEAFRTVLYYNEVPSTENMLIIAGLSVGVFGMALWLFKYLEKGFISNF